MIEDWETLLRLELKWRLDGLSGMTEFDQWMN